MSKRFKLMTISMVLIGILAATFTGAAFAAGPPRTDGEGQNSCGQGWGGCHGQGAICSETVSELLGLTHEEIEAQRHEGKSMVEIAAAQGVTEDTLVEAILAAKKKAIQEKVEAGILTQEQSDRMFQQMEQRTIEAVNRTSVGPVGPPDWSRGNGRGACFSETGLGTGPGDMHRWGHRAR